MKQLLLAAALTLRVITAAHATSFTCQDHANMINIADKEWKDFYQKTINHPHNFGTKDEWTNYILNLYAFAKTIKNVAVPAAIEANNEHCNIDRAWAGYFTDVADNLNKMANELEQAVAREYK
jgi:hypothetical protein